MLKTTLNILLQCLKPFDRKAKTILSQSLKPLYDNDAFTLYYNA